MENANGIGEQGTRVCQGPILKIVKKCKTNFLRIAKLILCSQVHLGLDASVVNLT